MRYIDISPNDKNVPIFKRILANSASTVKDGLIPFGSTVASVQAQAFDSDSKDVSAHLISGTSLNGDLAKIYINGSTEIPKDTYKINLNITYESGIYNSRDSYVPIALVKIR